MSDTFEQLLERAASAFGIDAGYWDIWGNHHTTTLAVKRSILRALGVPAESAESLSEALRELKRREWERLLPTAIVATLGGVMELPLNLPSDEVDQAACVTLTREDGETAAFEISLGDLPQAGSLEMNGRTWVRKLAVLQVQLPLGYHEITVRVGALSATARLIVTPERAWTNPHLGRSGRA